jgi:hypothetical protein
MPMTSQKSKDRPRITLCIGGCVVNRIYHVLRDGSWSWMRIPFIKEYNVNGVLCPDCQATREEAFEKAQTRPRMSEKDRVLRSWGHNPTGSI